MIRKLQQNEKILTRPLYEEAFFEDTEPLVDYYYREKMADNTVWASLSGEDPDGTAGTGGPHCGKAPGGAVPHVNGMICLNPYRAAVGGREYPLSYIVAVATEKAHRREGIMRSLLTAVLRAEHARHVPFTFLEPAKEIYYTPFGFARASFRIPRVLNSRGRALKRIPVTEENSGSAAEFMNRFLSARYEIRCIRDGSYLHRLLEEVRAAEGTAEMLADEAGVIRGTMIRDYGDTPDEAARLLIDEAYTEPFRDPETGEKAAPRPFIMIRITDLPEFLKGIRLAESQPAAAEEIHYFRFPDPLIPENDGLWRWTIGVRGSRAERIPEAALPAGLLPGAVPVFPPAVLEAWLTGYGPGPKEAWCGKIRPYGGAYFDEET